MKKIFTIAFSVLLFSTQIFAIDDPSSVSNDDFFDISDSDIKTKDVSSGSNQQLEETKKRAKELGENILKKSEELGKKAKDFITSEETKKNAKKAWDDISDFFNKKLNGESESQLPPP